MHPESHPAEYARAQEVIERGRRVQDTPRSFIYICELNEPDMGGCVLVARATQTGKGLWVQSYRRLSHEQALRDAEVSRLLDKVMDK